MAEAQTNIPEQKGFDVNELSKLLGNINVGSLAPLLNNINLTQLLPLIPSVLKMFGGNSPLGSIAPGVFNNNTQYGLIPSVPNYGAQPNSFIVPPHLQGDPRFVVLGAIKPFLPQDKGLVIDQVMKYLALFLTISAVLPRAPIKVPLTTPFTNPTPIVTDPGNVTES